MMIQRSRIITLLILILLPVAILSMDVAGKPAEKSNAEKSSNKKKQEVSAEKEHELFNQKIVSIFENKCVACHNKNDAKGELSLDRFAAAVTQGGESGQVIEPGDAESSLLMEYIIGELPEMPKGDTPLSKDEIAAIRKWIDAGAKWPKGVTLKSRWWSTEKLVRPKVPSLKSKWIRTEIDAFILQKLNQKGLQPNAETDRRTLIRRLYFDLTGLPPTPQQIEAFLTDKQPKAYERLVDRLLNSKRYGERWARHWLDVVHYGDTHGYDKDKVRLNAWPYRDYVIRSFNEDKNYSRFVQEQLAGDVLWPNHPDGIVATGFIAAGPFDWVGHIELRESLIDKKITRNLDRDDMVATTMNTFNSLTVQCARCHNHRFDPISQEDYYSLQAVFAAVDRADRPYVSDPKVAKQRGELIAKEKNLQQSKSKIDQQIIKSGGQKLATITLQITQLQKQINSSKKRAEHGYHSQSSIDQNVIKWVQVDLGSSQSITQLVLVGCYDDFAGIGAGFGFPVRYKIEISDDAKFKTGVKLVKDSTTSDFSNPGTTPITINLQETKARYVRVTATKLAHRSNDYIFALAEFRVDNSQKKNLAFHAKVTSLDSIEAPVRWQRKNLVDGYYVGIQKQDAQQEVAKLIQQKKTIIESIISKERRNELNTIENSLQQISIKLKALPQQAMVYAAATRFAPIGSFTPTNGKMRPIHVLKRGKILSPMKLVSPGTVTCISALPSRFNLSKTHTEGQRRIALAHWITDRKNVLTWRSIVNRIWQFHFGRGLVDSPNDFGRMGSRPTHPELLDYLAVEFRDGGQSFKKLHRLIVTSSVYRQASTIDPKMAKIDGSNQFLWRMNRRRLEAEAVWDSVLVASGKMNYTMGGPGYRVFGFKDDHSPHYKYQEHDPSDVKSHRRSIYRFIVRSVPDPFMETLDCADPTITVAKRNQTLTALQALALLNNKFMIEMSKNFAIHIRRNNKTTQSQIVTAYQLALGRRPTASEVRDLTALAKKHGMNNVCRLIFNLNEFVFVD